MLELRSSHFPNYFNHSRHSESLKGIYLKSNFSKIINHCGIVNYNHK